MARAQSTYVPPAPAQTHGNGLQGLGEIPWFSGDESPATTTFEDWLATFQLIAEANRWSDARKFSILPIRLKGTAKEVYQGLDKTLITNYTTMVAELKAVLAVSATRTVPLSELANLKHEPGKSVIQFGYKVKRLVDSIQPDPNKAGNWASIYFRAGLTPLYRQQLKPEYETFQDMMHDAKRLEDAFGDPVTTTLTNTTNTNTNSDSDQALSRPVECFGGC